MELNLPPSAFAGLLMDLGQQAQEKSLEELFDALEIREGTPILKKLGILNKTLEYYEIDINARIQDQPPDQKFLLRRRCYSLPSSSTTIERIANLETARQEFKSSYWCDIKRRNHQIDATIKDLRSEPVKHSALKSIAGFLTTGGGTLFVGVRDNGEILGLEPDLQILASNDQTIDCLVNNIKTDISHLFRDGNLINSYVSIFAIEVENKKILQLEIASRRNLSYLKSRHSDYCLFRRQDNRTTSVQVYEVEEFQEWRKNYVLASKR